MADGDKWADNEDISAARMNVKTVYVGTAGPSSPTDGMVWIDTNADPPIIRIYDLGTTSWKLAITNLTQIGIRSHASLTSIGANSHHNQSHSHGDHAFGEAELIANKDAAGGYPKLETDKTLSVEYIGIVKADTLKHSNDAAKTTVSGTYAKVKETKIEQILRGSIRIKFRLISSRVDPEVPAAATIYGRIRKDGVAWGTEHSYNHATGDTSKYVEYSEDFDPVDLASQLKIQIYCKTSNPSGVKAGAQNFRLCYDVPILDAKEFTNQDP